ncbi:hypothetical protein DL766_002133 [Monosporascus sp. MC13-8B]|uniref:Protein-lysine N-methyltransferase EFM6 n=1 Tax=Monosporascus cannonballus TaxID=155416 RepID=A0ABY0GXN4_9PEZI|nr:hypothetical protein DL762_009053 [Monosporascus cannonballus]RYO79571.1 hypothetical protein DL763_009218 [Monosporascus cannonballus]RYP36246.1 hypothetical protein DL766_002133 [Monosporascus sp. MC13-8B]
MLLDNTASPELSPLAIGEDISPLPTIKSAGTTEVDFSGLLTKPLRLHEDLAQGCGGQLWPAGMTLARHMLRYHRDDLRKSRILELGAGGGLVGLAVAKGCAVNGPLYVTDQAEMFRLMEHNIALNDLSSRVKAAVLNWGKPLPQEIVDLRPDVILAADCVYFEPAFPLLMATLTDLLTLCPSATIFFCFKKRRRADMQFLKKAQKTFRVVEIEDEDRRAFSREGLFLYAFSSKAQHKQLPRDEKK